MSSKLGAAVVGLGMMGEGHARIWSELTGTRLVQAYDVVAGRAEAIAAKYGGHAAASLEAALSDPDVHIVSVCVDDQRHVDSCIKAAQVGKHILVEKPLATTVADCDAIIAACRTAGVTLMVGHVVRFDPRYAAAKHAIDGGAVGDPIQIYARRNNLIASGLRIQARTSVAFFLGVHDIDIMRWFVGSEIVSVTAESARKVLTEADDSIFALMRFANGCVGCLETCWVIPAGAPNPLDARMEIVGTAGRVSVRLGDESFEVCSDAHATRPDVSYGPVIAGRLHGALRAQLEHFAECVRAGRQPLITPEDARAAVAVAEAIHRSLKSGSRAMVE
ncbi:MAG TPA: Gfo/Idh/MocA family oxidoreductase [Armatimonadota bacterium]|jgi:predicted dehydrogenase